MEGVVPADIARQRQQLLAEQLLVAESALSRLSLDHDNHDATVHAALDLVQSCGRAYTLNGAMGRRDYNQRSSPGFSSPSSTTSRGNGRQGGTHAALAALQPRRDGVTAAVDQEQQRRQGLSPDCAEYVSVLINELLVELRGLNPLTFSLRGLGIACAQR